MKWLSKLQSSGVDEAKFGKKLKEQIADFKDLQSEISGLEAQKDSVPPESVADFISELNGLKADLNAIDGDIVIGIDKYIANSEASKGRVAAMQEGRKRKAEEKKAATGTPTPTPTPAPAPTPTPAATGTPAPSGDGAVEVPQKKTSWTNWILGGVAVLLTGGIAYNMLKKRD